MNQTHTNNITVNIGIKDLIKILLGKTIFVRTTTTIKQGEVIHVSNIVDVCKSLEDFKERHKETVKFREKILILKDEGSDNFSIEAEIEYTNN